MFDIRRRSSVGDRPSDDLHVHIIIYIYISVLSEQISTRPVPIVEQAMHSKVSLKTSTLVSSFPLHTTKLDSCISLMIRLRLFPNNYLLHGNQLGKPAEAVDKITRCLLLLVCCLAHSLTLKMEAICSSETPDLLRSTRLYNVE
jgi:hypothetical protein